MLPVIGVFALCARLVRAALTGAPAPEDEWIPEWVPLVGIHRENGAISTTFSIYQTFLAGSQRAPSRLACSFSA